MPRPRIALLVFALAAALVPAGSASAHRRPQRHVHHVAGACASSHAEVRAKAIRRSRDATLCLLNRVRARHGLRPLRLDRKLSRAARRHSRDMVRRRYFAHDSLDGRSPFDRMRATRYVPRNSSWVLGENIGWGSGSLSQPIALVRAWMHSPPHRHNLLSRHFRDVGIGIARGVPVRGLRHVPLRATFSVSFGAHRGRTRCG